MLRTVALVATLGLAAADPATAAMMDGHTLRFQCAGSEDVCAAYVAGVVDQWNGIEDADLKTLRKCMPDFSLGGLMAIALAYIDGHTDQLASPAPELIIAAIEEALDC